jgi:hypothetical protein
VGAILHGSSEYSLSEAPPVATLMKEDLPTPVTPMTASMIVEPSRGWVGEGLNGCVKTVLRPSFTLNAIDT